MMERTEGNGQDDRALSRLDLRRLAPVFLVVCFTAASVATVVTILPFRLQDLGASPAIVGVVLGLGAVTQLIGAPLAGQLSDRLGRKPVLLVCQAGAALSLCLLGLAQNLLVALLGWVLLNLAVGTVPVATAFAADISDTANRRQALGLLSAALGVGGLVGPSVAGLLSDISLAVPFWGAMALSAVGLAVTAVFLRDPRTAGTGASSLPSGTRDPTRVSLRSITRAPLVRILVVILLCYYAAYGMYNTQAWAFLNDTFVWNGHGFGPKELGYLLTVDGAINIVIQLFVLKWLGRRLSERRLILLVFGVLSTGCLLVAFANSIAVLVLGSLLVSTAAAVARPTFVAAISVRAPAERQGVLMGSIQSLVAVTDIVSPMIAGLIVGERLYAVWFGTVIAAALLGAAIAATRLRPKDEQPLPVAETA